MLTPNTFYRDAISDLDDDERVSIKTDTLGGKQEMTFVSESGLYSLIFNSRKPEARRFRKWVTQEVLPAIRRSGGYGLLPPREAILVLREINRIETSLVKADTAYRFQSLLGQLQFHYGRIGWPMPDVRGLFKSLRYPQLIETDLQGLLGFDGEA